jgi:hypothetical protein
MTQFARPTPAAPDYDSRGSASWSQAPHAACFGSKRRGTGLIGRTAEGPLRRGGGHPVGRVILTHEVGRGGFWLARFLVRRGVEVHVMTAVLRELKETEIKDKRADYEARADKAPNAVT